MELTLQEKHKLIGFFQFLLDEEISKPLGEMNTEATDNYIKILLHLQDKHVELSPDFINEQVRKIFHPEEKIAAPETAKTAKKKYNKKRIWLVAACLALLVALLSIVSFSTERGVIDTLEEFFGEYEFIPYGKEITVNGETYEKGTSIGQIYYSVEEFVNSEKMDILYPQNIAETLDHISVSAPNDLEDIYFYYSDSSLTISITFDTEISQEIKDFCNDKVTINGIEYYLCIMEDVNQAQAYFMHNNNMYEIIHTDKDSLMKMLNSMEEIKYEN